MARFSSSRQSRRQFLRRHAAAAALAAGTLGLARRAAAADGGRNPFAYDVEKYRRVDPAWLRYERLARFKCPRPDPRRLALGPGDRYYVASGRHVSLLSGEGGVLSEMEFAAPVRSLAVAPDGTVYAGLRDHVEVHDARGRRQAQWEAPQGKPFLTGLAVGPKDILVADAGNRLVWRHDPTGKVVGRIGEKNADRGIPGLVLPSPFLDVELGADGLVRINNPGRHRVETYTLKGDLEFAWGKPSMALEGFCGCCNPVNLALLPDGRCVTFEKGLPRVKVYSAHGELECAVAGPESFADTGREEAISDADESTYGGLDGLVDSVGRVVVLDLLAGDLQMFRRKPEPKA